MPNARTAIDEPEVGDFAGNERRQMRIIWMCTLAAAALMLLLTR